MTITQKAGFALIATILPIVAPIVHMLVTGSAF